MISWKTTLFALIAAIGGAILGAYELKPALLTGFPSWLPGVALLMSVIGTACIGIFARDNDKSSEQVGAGGASQVKITRVAILFLLGLMLTAAGCARFSTKQTDLSYDDQGKPLRKITTRATATTFVESRSALANFKASQTDKTQSATVGSLTQESQGSNSVNSAAQFLGELIKTAR